MGPVRCTTPPPAVQYPVRHQPVPVVPVPGRLSQIRATQTDTITKITERECALIPITIDHLGRLGYTAHEFLGMPDTTQFRPTKPPWNEPADLSRTQGQNWTARDKTFELFYLSYVEVQKTFNFTNKNDMIARKPAK